MKPPVYLYGCRVFDDRYPMRLKLTEYNFLIELEGLPEVHSVFRKNEVDLNGIVWRSTSDTDDYVARRMMGMEFLTGDEVADDIKMNTLKNASPTAAQIAEVYDSFGTLRFCKTEDVVTVFENLDAYLTEMLAAKSMMRNYRLPPQEDIDKLKKLRDAIENMSDTIMVEQYGDTGFSTLVELFGGTTIAGMAVKEEVEEEGFTTGTAKPKPLEEQNLEDINIGGDPFAFLGAN
ncbi:hypothetical protein [Vibrio phage vB_VmeM-Yong XC32]|nr:hypothetical protein [Vibrio phage vB_VmeM-Yong XC31]QAX96324.1 hypothetical protein [Vibrio phage vB_VmeM-Yong XC32]QAX96642.1 hypothetical protein [Vibrio phage vB_VmeM-Yong MS31]QAX96960.1 hypothetical protein [Vibrio phage vB_VmeM-Yong MS32]